MHPTDLLRPFAHQLLADALRQSYLQPSPADAARQLAPGPRADRVLLIGGGIACGMGVRSQELALPGRLAQALSRRTLRGAAVDVVAERSVLVAEAPSRLAGARLPHYDAVVLAFGTADGYRLTSLARWRSGLHRLLDAAAEHVAAGTVLLVAGTSPLPRTFAGHRPMLAVWDGHAARMDRITAEVCAERGDSLFVPLGLPAGGRAQMGAGDYDTIAQAMATRLESRLDALERTRPPGCARDLRDSHDPELLRQEALERTGLLASEADRRLDRLLRNARDVLGTRAAAITLIDGDQQRTKAIVGGDPIDLPRGDAVCNRTIRKDAVHIESDLAGQAMAEQGWRFYAGYPLESPDGYRIGALCVIDDEPRDAATVDRSALHELAVRVQNELWAEIERTRVAG